MKITEITAQEFKDKLKDPVIFKLEKALATFESMHGDTWKVGKLQYNTLEGKEIIITVHLAYEFDKGMKNRTEERNDINKALEVLEEILPARFHSTIDFEKNEGFRTLELTIWLKDL
jgi:hypothetical protein